MERYQGVRIYRDGINVPPYGIHGDDWAGLEKQRTKTGGPTLVPGNSQLVGELHIRRDDHPGLVVTAGRSGFADQQAVDSMARYVRWAVKELGTARRAAHMSIADGGPVPARIDGKGRSSAQPEKPTTVIEEALEEVTATPAVKESPELRRLLDDASKKLLSALETSEEMLRLYAQLASTGIAATSFAHELRGDFDVITDGVAELRQLARKSDREVVQLIATSWSRVSAFAALFQLVPVKLRRKAKVMSSKELSEAARTALGLANPETVESIVSGPTASVKIVPAEFDSILVNLISNAVKAIGASRNREAGRIEVLLVTDSADLDIRVADNGCGVTDKVARIMFEPLEGTFSEGTGMGLPIVQFLASRYNGSVSLSDKPPPSYTTEFHVSLRGVVGGQ